MQSLQWPLFAVGRGTASNCWCLMPWLCLTHTHRKTSKDLRGNTLITLKTGFVYALRILMLSHLHELVRSSRNSEPIYSSTLGLSIMNKMQIKRKNIWNLWRRYCFEISCNSEVLGGKNTGLKCPACPAFWLCHNNKNNKNSIQHFKNILHQNEAYKTIPSKQFVIIK